MKSAIAAVAFVAVMQAAGAAGTSVVLSGLTPSLGGDTVTKKVVVKFDDLNPADKAGATKLLERLNLVAGALCTSNTGGKSPLLTDKVEKCRAQAVAQAVKDIDTAELTAAAAAAK